MSPGYYVVFLQASAATLTQEGCKRVKVADHPNMTFPWPLALVIYSIG